MAIYLVSWIYNCIFFSFSCQIIRFANHIIFDLYTFLTSNVIRMVSWIPLLGRNGLFNSFLLSTGIIDDPQEWFLYSHFSVVLAFIHLYTLFMIVPIFNSMLRIDKSIIEAAYDAGANGFQILINIIIPLVNPALL